MAGDDKGRAGAKAKAPKRDVKKRVVFVLADPSATNEPVVLDDSSALAALADPFRLRIVKQLREPASARELAQALDRPITSLYHHLDLLERAGLIAVADVQREGRTFVRRYARVSDRFETTGEVGELGDLLQSLDPNVKTRRIELTRQIAAAVSSALGDDRRAEKRLRMLLRGRIDPDRLDELSDRLKSVLGEFFDDAGETFDVVVTVSRATDDQELEKR